jgi:hypothetical protein
MVLDRERPDGWRGALNGLCGIGFWLVERRHVMDKRLILVPVRRVGMLLTVLTLVMALVVLSLAPVASAQAETPVTSVPVDSSAGDISVVPGHGSPPTLSCSGNLLQNPSFEAASGSNPWGNPYPSNWTHQGSGFTGAVNLYNPPDGTRVGYVIHATPASTDAIMYQQVAATPGNTYEMTFYSGTHEPGKQPTIAIRFYDGTGSEIGTAAIHTITTDLEVSGSLGGPYTLTGTAPAGAANLRVIFTDPASTATPFAYAGAKGDALCLKLKPPTAVSLAGFSASGSQMPWGGFALLGAVLGALVVSRRRSQK